MSKWLVVGLSGVTNGGKTTLANKLLDTLPADTRIIKQDNYFYLEDDPRHVPCPGGLKHHNWDVISSLDMERMVQDVKDIINPQPKINSDVIGQATALSKEAESSNEIPGARSILLLDGFLLFSDPRLNEICDLRYFLTLTRDQCWERRRQRTYDPPDPPGYFDHCVWPMYEDHLKFVKENVNDVTILDGSIDHFPDVLPRVLSAAGLETRIDQQNVQSGSCAYL